MKVTNSLIKADIILRLLQEHLENYKSSDRISAFTCAWRNGRENGYSVAISVPHIARNKAHRVTFCECRSSDTIIVYPGFLEDDIDAMPASMFNHQREFRPDEYVKAAKWCFDYLVKPIPKLETVKVLTVEGLYNFLNNTTRCRIENSEIVYQLLNYCKGEPLCDHGIMLTDNTKEVDSVDFLI